MKMMARNPADRYQTPAEAAEALKGVSFAPSVRRKPLQPRSGFKKPVSGLRPPLGRKPQPGRPFGPRDKKR
jgi:hypothetical protein